MFKSQSIFRSQAIFTLFDFAKSHSRVLFRGSSDKSEFVNTDVIFEDVYYLELPTIFYGLEIFEIELTRQVIKKFKNSEDDLENARLFKLASMKQEFIIGSYTCVIQYNRLMYPVSSLYEQDSNALTIAVPRKKTIEK